MSRIGFKPIEIPEGVEVEINDANVTVKGPKGEMSRTINKDMDVEIQGNTLTVARPTEGQEHRSLHGTTRSVIANMIQGVNTGFEKKLEINGVGYRAQMQGDTLVVNVGYSNPIEFKAEPEIDIEVPNNSQIVVKGIDKERVGAVAANIRSIRIPEPYKGKGIRYENERIIQKEGKTGK